MGAEGAAHELEVAAPLEDHPAYVAIDPGYRMCPGLVGDHLVARSDAIAHQVAESHTRVELHPPGGEEAAHLPDRGRELTLLDHSRQRVASDTGSAPSRVEGDKRVQLAGAIQDLGDGRLAFRPAGQQGQRLESNCTGGRAPRSGCGSDDVRRLWRDGPHKLHARMPLDCLYPARAPATGFDHLKSIFIVKGKESGRPTEKPTATVDGGLVANRHANVGAVGREADADVLEELNGLRPVVPVAGWSKHWAGRCDLDGQADLGRHLRAGKCRPSAIPPLSRFIWCMAVPWMHVMAARSERNAPRVHTSGCTTRGTTDGHRRVVQYVKLHRPRSAREIRKLRFGYSLTI